MSRKLMWVVVLHARYYGSPPIVRGLFYSEVAAKSYAAELNAGSDFKAEVVLLNPI